MIKRKGFTLIEVLISLAVIAILVLLAGPRLLGYTDKAKLTELTNNTREVQSAAERYYLDNDDWPRLTDEPYTKEEVENFSNKFYDMTGKEIDLDPDGKYYDIDFDELGSYINIPGNKANYILQNPVGKVYALSSPTEEASERLEKSIPRSPGDFIIKSGVTFYRGSTINIEWGESSRWGMPQEGKTYRVEYKFNNEENYVFLANTGTLNEHPFDIPDSSINSSVQFRVRAENELLSSSWKEVSYNLADMPPQFTFSSSGSNYSEFIVPVTGTYKITVEGAKGGRGGHLYSNTWGGGISISGRTGSYGSLMSGEFELNQGDVLYVYQGTMGRNGSNGANYTGSRPKKGYGGGGGGGASSLVKLNKNSEENIIISAQGGNGGRGGYGGTSGKTGSPGSGGISNLSGKGSSGSRYNGGSGGGVNLNKGTNTTEANSTKTTGKVIIEKID